MINWFWSHRRNTSLHHMSLFVRGLKAKGFLPEVNFYFDNQIFMGITKGCYIYYDRDQLNQKYKDVQKSIDNNPNFAQDFRKKQDKIFDAVFTVCDKISTTNLKQASKKQLLDLLSDFAEKLIVGPLITVQLWGIEACWDDDYVLSKELKEKRPKDFDVLKGDLSQSTGKTVAYSERESFLKLMIKITQNKQLCELLQEGKFASADELLETLPTIKQAITTHIDTFAWMNTEYVSEPWTMDEWYEQMAKELDKPEQQYEQLQSTYKNAIEHKDQLIKEIGFSKKAQHILTALNEFVAQRDWAKGKMCHILAIYDMFLNEIVMRLGINKKELLLYDFEELANAIIVGNSLDISKREEGWALVSKHGDLQILDATQLPQLIKEEQLTDMQAKIIQQTQFHGVPACKGKATGIVRVIDNPKDISQFQNGEILVTYMTTMQFTPLFKKAAGIITDEGGLSSHAAIVSREFNVPCIVGTQIATRNLKTGDKIEMDANIGFIKLL